jgi:hypothetical protein
VVLFVIDAKSVITIEFECDAPWSVHMNRIANRLSMQTVKVKTELIHFVGARCGVEFSQAPQDPALHFGVDFRSFALPPELTKGFAFERFDHDLSRLLTCHSM